MADEAEGRLAAEEVSLQAEDNGGQQVVDVVVQGEVDRGPITVDAVVDAFFASEESVEKASVGDGQDDQEAVEDQGSDDETEARAQVPDEADDELQAQVVEGAEGSQTVSEKSAGEQQQAVTETSGDSEEMKKDIDDKEKLSDAESPQSPALKQKKEDSDWAESPEDSADEDGVDREDNQRTEESSKPGGDTSVGALQTAPVDTGSHQSADHDDEEVDDKDDESDNQDHKEESRSELGSEPGDMNAMNDFAEAGDHGQGAEGVSEDLVQNVLDRVMMAETGIVGEAAGTGQEVDTNAGIPELDKVDLVSEDGDSETQSQTKAGPAMDNASLAESEVDKHAEEDTENLPSDSHQVPEAEGDLKDAETGSAVDLQPCEGESELLGESQQLYQYADDRSWSTASPRSQGEVRSVQQGHSRSGHSSDQRPSPKSEYPLNIDNYKVCRMLSPGIKECLILETGEQVVYDCSRHGVPASTRPPASQPNSHRPSNVDKVKRNLFADEIQDAGDDRTAPDISDAAPGCSELPPPPVHSPSQPSSTSAQDRPSARDHQERPQEAEESYDGSYLWLQRQVQWRAGSAGVPPVRGSRESTRADQRVSDSYTGYLGPREEMRGSSMQDTSGESRVGMSMSSADVSRSLTSPGAIPNFSTLRDQQVSWLSMYRMLEEQHRSQLQAQYSEHQQMINDMQRQLEGELLSQQQSMRQKLDSHREALRDMSAYSGGSSSRMEGGSNWYKKHASPTQSDGDKLPLSEHSSSLQQDYTTGATRSYQDRPGQSSRDGLRSSEIGQDKRLRGGVYSSPMPTARFRPKERSSYEARAEDPYTGPTERRGVRQTEEEDSDSRQPSAQTLSPRTHQSLREKHAKHLSDLRSYYEAEIQDLRQKLSAEGLRPSSSGAGAGSRDLSRERLLQEENQMLRLQLRDLQDSLDDSHIYSRDLEQKLQGLEIRAADYAKRYEESQNTVLKLKNRLEELHSYAKDRESVLEQVQVNERRQTAALQEMYKAKEEYEETARRDTATIKRLLDKYEMLEKDHSGLKDKCAEFEQKLFDTRSETVQLNKIISQLELENKRLTHDNDNMRHRLAISGSLPITRQELAGTEQHRGSYENVNGYTADGHALPQSQTHSARVGWSSGGDATPPRRGLSDDEDAAALGKSDSPLLRAERELRRLQQTLDHGEFIPRLQPKKYTAGSLCPASGEVTIIDALSSPTRSGSSVSVDAPKEGVRRGKKAGGGEAAKRVGQSKQLAGGRSPPRSSHNASSVSSPTRFDVGAAVGGSAVGKKGRGREGAGERKEGPAASSAAAKSLSKDAHRLDSTLERIRSGEFVSRPQWEDVYTSLAKPTQPDKTPSINMTQEEMLRDRIRSIDQMERHYDDLQVEKRKLESQLNKVPAHGRDRKSRREKELLEEKLDKVDHELGSLRMTLKRYQVLKTSM